MCANCSPHRITIPRQYIVHPPTLELSGDDDDENPRYTSNPALGGGEEVRVCNPCVPDPNYNPPPQAGRPESWQSQNSFQRPFYGAPSPSMPFIHPNNQMPGDFARLLPNFAQPPGFIPPPGEVQPHSHRPDVFRDGRVSFHNPSSVSDLFPPPASANPHRRSAPVPPFNSTTPTSHHHHSRSVSSRYRSPSYIPGPPSLSPSPHPGHMPGPQSASLPSQRRQIPEEDECPICGDELPPKGSDGTESARESHVQECISTHFSGGGSSRERPAATPVQPLSNIATPADVETSRASHSPSRASPQTSGVSSAAGPSRPRRMTANRMLVYRATEKDCVGEDGEEQECVICFEEFKVGVEMGRLECLCKFHKVRLVSDHP